MQITAIRTLLGWRTLAITACVLSSLSSSVMAQLRFAGPQNQAAPLRPAPSEPAAVPSAVPTPAVPWEDSIRTAQFRPLNPQDNPAGPSGSLTPQPPAPAEEMQVDPPSVMAPPADMRDAGEVIGPGEPLGDATGLPILPPDAVIDAPWGDAFDPQLMQQEQAMIYSTSAWFRRGFWYSQADVVALLRTENELVHISADNSGAGLEITNLHAPLLSSEDVDPSYVPGTRLSIGRFLGQDVVNRDYTIEFLFLGLFEYSEQATLTAITPNGLVDALGQGNHYVDLGNRAIMIGASTPGFGDAKQHDIRYDTDLNNFEFNFRILGRPLRDRIALQPNGAWVRNATASHLKSFLIGVRTMSINEMFNLRATFSNPATSGYSEVKTTNDMFGVQLGTEWIENYANWSWGVRFKGGGLFNFADRRSLIDVTLNGVPDPVRQQTVRGENLAAVVEAGLVATYEIRPDLLARIAYDAIYVQGIATAPENMSLAEHFPVFEVTGDCLFHGLSVGLEMMW